MSQPVFSPPPGVNFHCRKDWPIAALSKALHQVCAFIQDFELDSPLTRYEDWWEHDGLHFNRGAITLHDLFGLVESPQSLLNAMQGDDRVFVGIAPADATWYLRFYADWDEQGSELIGRFDITLPAAARVSRQYFSLAKSLCPLAKAVPPC